MKPQHTASVRSIRMVIMLKKNPGVDADFGHSIEMRRVKSEAPVDFNPPTDTRAYAFYWEHQVTVTTPQGRVSTTVLQPIGGMFTDTPNWPTREAIQYDTNCPGLLGTDPLPYSLLWAGHKGRSVTVFAR